MTPATPTFVHLSQPLDLVQLSPSDGQVCSISMITEKKTWPFR
jgi:hypothetical protein